MKSGSGLWRYFFLSWKDLIFSSELVMLWWCFLLGSWKYKSCYFNCECIQSYNFSAKRENVEQTTDFSWFNLQVLYSDFNRAIHLLLFYYWESGLKRNLGIKLIPLMTVCQHFKILWRGLFLCQNCSEDQWREQRPSRMALSSWWNFPDSGD